jgi:uncharacterized protein
MSISNNSTLDGKRLYYSFLAGAYNVFEHQKHLNQINVFPVPDADTGTNLASTFRSIVENTVPSTNIKQTSVAIADAALTGARGNSGIIIAQFLYGFSNELDDREHITLKDFANAMIKAVEYAYKAISNPVEGTIITVLREWAEFIYMIHEKYESFELLMKEALLKAQESLAKTPEKLKILATANVVDAGAKGFVIFLEGISRFFQKETLKKILSFSSIATNTPAALPVESHENTKFRYCTEAMITIEVGTKPALQEYLESMGDSLVLAGPERRMRMHIHTNEPAEVFANLTQRGKVLSQKVDDMHKQNEIAANRKFNIALVIDSTCDLPQEIIDQYQIHVIPLNVFFGEQQYLDRVTITQDKFFELLEESPDYPTSSQPSLKDVTNTFNYLTTHYDSIIALHLSEKLSGTFANSMKAAENIAKETGKRIDVINTRQLSGTFGLLALRVAEAIEQGWTQDQIMEQVETWSDNARILVGIKSLDSFIKGGRVTATKGFIGKMLGMRPIVSLDKEGKSMLFKKAFSQKGSLKKIMKLIREDLQHKKLWKYNIVHAYNPETAQWFAGELEKLTGQKPEYIMALSPVVAISAGRGTVAVSVMTQ